MRKTLQILVIFLFCATSVLAQDREAYIEKYKNIAIREMERTGVPASIKLAQGLLESGAGSSYLAKKANNHFGIKCGPYWKGKSVEREDDDYDDNGKLIKSCFRAYKSADESYIAHSEFLRNPNAAHRYGFLFQYDVTDYKRWARGLKRAGYATSASYDKKLIDIIERYSLNRFDRMSSGDLQDDINYDDVELIAGLDIRRINDVKVVYAERNDTPDNIGNKAKVKTKCILKYNEMLPEAATLLEDDELVFLQKKRKNFRGEKKWHYVREGETMYNIAQLYGVRLKNLYKRNLMPEDAQPEKDERIKLRGWKVSSKDRPRLRSGYVAPVRPQKPKNTDKNKESDENWMDTENAVEIDDKPSTSPPTRPNTNNNSSSGNPSSGNPNSGNNNGNGTWNGSGSTTNPPNNPPPVTTPTTVHPPIFTPNPPTNSGSSSATYHIVVKGDTLYSLSRRYGVTVEDIKRWNGLVDNTIYPDSRLRVK